VPHIRRARRPIGLIKSVPDNFHYENGLTVANGDYVLLHGRFHGLGLPANWIVVDIVRLENGLLQSTGTSSRTRLRAKSQQWPAHVGNSFPT